MEYQKKYLKYKNKYLDLKNQIGGTVFTIYTTGIADWTNGVEISRTMQVWNDVFCNHLLTLIPERFTRIRIQHYDTLQQLATPSVPYNPEDPFFRGPTAEERTRISAFINHELVRLDNTKPRVESSFSSDYLPTEEIERITNSYILIDLAHVYENVNEHNCVKYSYEITESIRDPAIKEIESRKRFNLQRIHPSYLGDYYDLPTTIDSDRNEINECMLTKLFEVNADNTVTTIINKIITNNHMYGKNNVDNIVEFRDDIEKIIENIKKRKYGYDEDTRYPEKVARLKPYKALHWKERRRRMNIIFREIINLYFMNEAITFDELYGRFESLLPNP